VTTAALDPCTGTATPPTVGQACTDGSVYAGLTPDGNVPMYVTPCDYGETGAAHSCIVTLRRRPSCGEGGCVAA
jgi:hypothetical protein